jgi:hypothetical protein
VHEDAAALVDQSHQARAHAAGQMKAPRLQPKLQQKTGVQMHQQEHTAAMKLRP